MNGHSCIPIKLHFPRQLTSHIWCMSYSLSTPGLDQGQWINFISCASFDQWVVVGFLELHVHEDSKTIYRLNRKDAIYDPLLMSAIGVRGILVGHVPYLPSSVELWVHKWAYKGAMNDVYFSNAQRPTKVKWSLNHCSVTTSFPSKFHLASILNDSQLENPWYGKKEKVIKSIYRSNLKVNHTLRRWI